VPHARLRGRKAHPPGSAAIPEGRAPDFDTPWTREDGLSIDIGAGILDAPGALEGQLNRSPSRYSLHAAPRQARGTGSLTTRLLPAAPIPSTSDGLEWGAQAALDRCARSAFHAARDEAGDDPPLPDQVDEDQGQALEHHVREDQVLVHARHLRPG